MEPAPPIDTMSEPMRQVMEALVAGLPAPANAQAALSDTEKAEVAAFARTSHLAKLALAKSEPPDEAEEKARARAQSALNARPLSDADRKRFHQNNPSLSPASPSGGAGALRAWWDRLRGKRSEG